MEAFDSVRFRLLRACGVIYSNTIFFNECTTPPGFGIQTQNQSINEDSSTYFFAYVQHGCGTGPGVPGLESWHWEVSYQTSGFFWTALDDTDNDTLFLDSVSYCNNAYRYRAVYKNGCGTILTSSAATLTVTKTNFADLMMRDYYNDDGTEKNSTTQWPQIYETPDLWIRWASDNDTNDRGADYPGPMYVYYRIKNKGTDTSKVADLYLHWTLGGANGQDFPVAWTYNSSNTFKNTDINSQYHNKTFPLGGPINEIAITIPSLAPQESRIAYFVWDSVPNPFWYSGFVGSSATYPDSLPLCLLARIHTCEPDSFGLYRKEITRTRTNIENNNNIVGRNTTVFNMGSIFMLKKLPLYVRTYDGTSEQMKIEIKEVNNCGFRNFGNLHVTMDNPLFHAWLDGGMKGNNFGLLADNTVAVTDESNFFLTAINLSPDSGSFLTLKYEMTTYPLSVRNCRFEVSQYYLSDTTVAIGGFVSIVSLQPEPEGGEGEMAIKIPDSSDELLGKDNPVIAVEVVVTTDEKVQEEPIEEEQSFDGVEVTAYPNPFSTEVNFEIITPEDIMVGFEVYNALGAQVGSIARREYTKGKTIVPFNGGQLAPGMYLCKVKIGDEMRTIRLVIVR